MGACLLLLDHAAFLTCQHHQIVRLLLQMLALTQYDRMQTLQVIVNLVEPGSGALLHALLVEAEGRLPPVTRTLQVGGGR